MRVRRGAGTGLWGACLLAATAGGCVFGFDTEVPEAATGDAFDTTDTADDAFVRADVIRGELDGSDVLLDADATPPMDVDGDADGDAADGSDPGPDAEDADATSVLRCSDIDCASEGRECVEFTEDTDAVCGECLSGFTPDGDECMAPACAGDGECTPDPATGAWGECGGYADSCATDGIRTRQLYAGTCVDSRCRVTTSEQTEACPEPRLTAGEACTSRGVAGVCSEGVCQAAPPAPSGVSASDGTSTDHVRITWSAVEGAAGYNVFLGGTLLTPTPITTLQFDHTNAPAGGVPEQVTGILATAATDRITVDWNSVEPVGSPGSSASYAVSAVNEAGEGPRSANDSGNRAGYPLMGYEVRFVPLGSWVSVGASNRYADMTAPAGTLVVSGVSASDGNSAAHVALAAMVTASAGETRTYEVRAVNAAGAGDVSSLASAQRTVGSISVQWQRSSGPSASGFGNIAGATSLLYNDTGAPSDGSDRHYRLIASAAGAVPVTSASDAGYRQAGGPAPGTLGGTCTADAQCPSGTWCSTVSGYRRCSPRLFSGLPHELDFVYVPSGTFQQGTPGSSSDDRPYSATLTRNYFVSRTEVTQGQWRAATGATNPACFQNASGLDCSTENANNSGPVERVNWYSAVAYANWLSEQNALQECYTMTPATCADNVDDWGGGVALCTGVTFVGQGCTGYRLLTESEWERAARGGTTTTYFWGDSEDAAVVGQYGWFDGNSGSRTQRAGSKQANGYGLYDTSGNVREWVWDLVYKLDFSGWHLYPEASAANYTGPSTGSLRGTRGGDWAGSESFMRSAGRSGDTATSRESYVGLRLARTAP